MTARFSTCVISLGTPIDPRMHQHFAVMRLLDEIIQHLFGDFEISDDAVFHWFNGDDIAGRTPEHFLRLLTHRFDLACIFVQGHDRRFIYDNALALRVHKGIGGAQIDGKIGRKKAKKRAELHSEISGWKGGACPELTFIVAQGIARIPGQ